MARTSKEIIVKFRDSLPLLREVNGALHAEGISLDAFNGVFAQVPEAWPRQSFPRMAQSIFDGVPGATRGEERGRANIDLFVNVRFKSPVSNQKFKDILDDLNDPAIVPDIAYAVAVFPSARPPSPCQEPSGGTGDFVPNQLYLEDGTLYGGVSGKCLWSFEGGAGDGVQVLLIDEAFEPCHEDLQNVVVEVLNHTYPNNDPGAALHGTKTLGVLAAKPNGFGITGLCNRSTMYFGSTWNMLDDLPTNPERTCVDSSTGYLKCFVESVLDIAMTGLLGEKDLVVVEAQQWGVDPDGKSVLVPFEINPHTRRAIQELTDKKIHVVSAVGNGDRDLAILDGPMIKTGVSAKIWATPGDEEDSGAVMVAGGGGRGDLLTSPANLHSAVAGTNWGLRVDCQGWGNHVATTSVPPDYGLYWGGDYASYEDGFDGSSAATAVIGGMVGSLLGITRKLEAAGVEVPEPSYLRELLATPDLGTSQGDGNRIGSLPDGRKLIRELNVFRDVYLRDNHDDVGAEPSTGNMYMSPDIIVTQENVPPETFGGAGIDDEVDFEVKRGSPNGNFVYLRLHNLGTVQDTVSARVYWAESSTFIHPANWVEIGGMQATVPAGGSVVAGPIVWPEEALPPTGHQCLIAHTNSACDPLADPRTAGSFANFGEYKQFVRDHNNMAHRNVNTVVVSEEASSTEVAFLMGSWDLDDLNSPKDEWSFDLAITGNLPPGAWLEVQPDRAVDRMRGRKPEALKTLSPSLPLRQNRGPLYLKGLWIPPRKPIRLTLRLGWEKPIPGGTYRLVATQVHRGDVVGRVTFRLKTRSARQPKAST